MIAIDDGIPPPKARRRGVRKYPILELEVGQSFFVKEGDPNSLAVCACNYGKQTGRTFRTAKVRGGIRVWRVA